MHDPAAILLAFRKDLFRCKLGRVRVATEGLCRGQTVMDAGAKLWSFPNKWTEHSRPPVEVALDVDAAGAARVFRTRFGITSKRFREGRGSTKPIKSPIARHVVDAEQGRDPRQVHGA